ncbi:hypothetical protein PsYK624_005330 [Phanerochaete sordida]|uniref:Uncharacterized protein n=1 Tax=Phanerochaete sordida TaxID=48140 RepID=A0A9P3FWM6_9APHY|nr:hypothetical protein PsYK624_005330 [Phanerochaete sordida]
MRRLGQRAAITALLLRDGTLDFIIVVTLTIIQIVIGHYPDLKIAIIGPFITVPAQLLPAVAICRFILNLRLAGETGGGQTQDTTASPSGEDLVFRAATDAYEHDSQIVFGLMDPNVRIRSEGDVCEAHSSQNCLAVDQVV